MKPSPTGRVVSTAQGRDLVLGGPSASPIDDVWASITEPERTALWLGRGRETAPRDAPSS
jgi:uncharacterized protein YndB with AHSA1/START domain